MQGCDLDTWYELHGHDGFGWQFIADFDSREEADQYNSQNDFGYDRTTVRQVRGIA